MVEHVKKIMSGWNFHIKVRKTKLSDIGKKKEIRKERKLGRKKTLVLDSIGLTNPPVNVSSLTILGIYHLQNNCS